MVPVFFAVLVFVSLLGISRAHATISQVVSEFLPSIGDVTSWAIGKVIYGGMYFVTSVVGFFITLMSWMIELVLVLNEHIVDSPPVQAGFSISLAIANLGFVLAIVIIAITTILRRESYGMKQTLWRLLIAAALVNFGLVIAAPIIHFSNDLTSYFNSPFQNLAGFRDALIESFSPQRLLQPGGSSEDPFENLRGAENIEGAGDSDLSGLLTTIITIAFTELMLVLILLTLGAFFVLLLIRYVALSILLILLPFVWLFWILPPLRGYLSRWWRMFFRWSFFAPVVTFFLYLAILAQRNMFSDPAYAVLKNAEFTNAGPSGSIIAAIADYLGKALMDPIIAGAQSTVILGLVIGGLFAANSLSIHTADIAVKAAKGVGSGFWNYARKGGPFRTFARIPGGVADSLTRQPSQTATGWRGTLQRLNPVHQIRTRLHSAAKSETVRDAATGETYYTAPGSKTAQRIITTGQALGRWRPSAKPNHLNSIMEGIGKKSGLWKSKKEKPSKEETKDFFKRAGFDVEEGEKPAAPSPEEETTTET